MILKRVIVRPLVMMVLALQMLIYKGAILLAQEGGGGGEKKVDVNVDIDGPSAAGGTVWYGNWWVWAIGIAVFLIVIVALTNRGGSRSDTA
jgi:hypothetical protein